MDLACEQQRIEGLPEIVDHPVAQDARYAGLRIDLHLGEMGAVRECRRRRREGILGGEAAPPRLGVAGKLGERDCAVGAGDARRAVGELEIAGGSLQRPGGNLLDLHGELLGRAGERGAAARDRA